MPKKAMGVPVPTPAVVPTPSVLQSRWLWVALVCALYMAANLLRLMQAGNPYDRYGALLRGQLQAGITFEEYEELGNIENLGAPARGISYEEAMQRDAYVSLAMPMRRSTGWPRGVLVTCIIVICLPLLIRRWTVERRLKVFSILAIAATLLLSINQSALQTLLVIPSGFLAGMGFAPAAFVYGYMPPDIVQGYVRLIVILLLLVTPVWIFGRTIVAAPRMHKRTLEVILGLFIVFAAITLNGVWI
jgi:hypothetical protein